MIARTLARGLRPLVERSPRLATTYRSFRDAGLLEREPVVTPLGFRFVGHAAMEQGLFEPDEVSLLQRLLPSFDLFVNVGCNIGYYCCLARQAGKPVVAFEPVPGNLRVLYRNLRANGWDTEVEIHPVAVGERAGLVDIYGGGTAASLLPGWADLSERDRQTVPITTLDRALGESPPGRRTLVMIDVEGAELGVLRGASGLLHAQPRPLWIVEISIDEHQPHGARLNPQLRQTFGMFEEAGYKAWALGPTLDPVAYEQVAEIARTGINTLRTHNFVFAEPDAAFLHASA